MAEQTDTDFITQMGALILTLRKQGEDTKQELRNASQTISNSTVRRDNKGRFMSAATKESTDDSYAANIHTKSYKDLSQSLVGDVVNKPTPLPKQSGGSPFAPLTNGLKGMGGSMKGMMASVGSAAAPLAAMGIAMMILKEPIEYLIEPVTMLGELFGTYLLPPLQPLVDTLYALAPTVEIIGKQFGEQLTPIIAALAPIVAQLLPPLMQLGLVMFKSMAPVLILVLNAISPLIPIFTQFIVIITPIVGIVNSILIPIIAIANPLGALIGMFVLVGDVINMVTGKGSALVDFFTNLGKAIGNWWEELW